MSFGVADYELADLVEGEPVGGRARQGWHVQNADHGRGTGDRYSCRALTAWEVVHHLIRVLEAGGEGAASELVKKLGGRAEAARELAYRLYTICERKKRAQ